jgi:hypothetical protein
MSYSYGKYHPCLKLDPDLTPIQNSATDMEFRGDYTGTNLIYKGFARAGAGEGDLVWQIAKLAYDGSNNLLSVKWPMLPPNTTTGISGGTSTEYEFSWTDRASYTYQ